MSANVLNIEVTEQSTITKYDVGVSPDTGKPFDVVENKPKVLKGLAAINYLKGLGYTEEQINNLVGGNTNGINTSR